MRKEQHGLVWIPQKKCLTNAGKKSGYQGWNSLVRHFVHPTLTDEILQYNSRSGIFKLQTYIVLTVSVASPHYRVPILLKFAKFDKCLIRQCQILKNSAQYLQTLKFSVMCSLKFSTQLRRFDYFIFIFVLFFYGKIVG